MSAPAPWRLVDLDGVGVEVRPVTLRDVAGQDVTDPSFIHRCVRHPGGETWTRDEVLDLPVAAANALAAEVMKSRPTSAPSGASGG
jgi:hypothetical protein